MFPAKMQTGWAPGSPTGVDIMPWVEAVLKVLLEKSVEVGCKYSQDAGRDNLSSEDVVRALKYQAFHFLNEPDLEARVAEYMTSGGSEDSPRGSEDSPSEPEDSPSGSGSEDSPSGSGSEDSPRGSEDSDHFTEANGSELAKEVNECCKRWDTWEPDTIQQQMLKRAIDKTIQAMG